MKVLFTSLAIFLLQLSPVRTQMAEDVLDLLPGKGDLKLAEAGITGFIDYQYSGEMSKAKGEVNQFFVIFTDPSGRISKSVEFNRLKKPENYYCNSFDENGNLVQRRHYAPNAKLLWREGFFYDVSGKLIEQVEYADDGSIDGKTLYFYNSNGLLYKTRQLNHAGELSFWRIIDYSENNLPERITLKQAQGLTMSNTLIRYNGLLLPVERQVSAGLKGPVIRQEFLYGNNHFLTEHRSFNEKVLTSINIRKYSRGSFDRMLMENKLYLDEVICPEFCRDSVISGFLSRASFPGGTAALESYLERAVDMPDSASQQGIVIVKFKVKRNGKVRRAQVHKGLTSFLDKMAVDIVQRMPKWIPAKAGDGKFENSTVYLPLVFLK